VLIVDDSLSGAVIRAATKAQSRVILDVVNKLYPELLAENIDEGPSLVQAEIAWTWDEANKTLRTTFCNSQDLL